MNLLLCKYRLFSINNLFTLFIVLFLISCYDNRNIKSVSKSTKLITSKESVVKKKADHSKESKTLLTSKKIPIFKSDSIIISDNKNKIDTVLISVLSSQNEIVIDSSELINIINSTNSNIVIDTSELILL
ncbi:MAG: hypothetical protein IPQ02_19855 [Saprospiraceae bacterium]|uniref:Uncharacterized protein n=1 Tax=Candidatus Defluviibacterium haderslevense TaxID=2981993 RepID=A0A9D7XG15_9BACT|nr:hypothetical protein [Candidatus Defluviibacterium haderslevense]MBL0238786.1 hypothetical protein [Candidatus Defluviibacterium haderslevense]